MPEQTFANYHTHTARCHHAEGADEASVQAAIRQGYHVLGFSDHTPWAGGELSRQVAHIRMEPERLEEYVASLRALGAKYAGQLRLHIGLEAEYFPALLPWLLEQKERLGIEYLLLGCHYDQPGAGSVYLGRATAARELRRYAGLVEAGLESGAYACLAHPDLCLRRWPDFDAEAEAASRQICAAAARTGTPLEYNLAGWLAPCPPGGLGYTTDAFWRVAAEYPVQVIVGSDAHAPGELADQARLRERQAWLRGLGLRVLDTLPGLE